MSALGLGRLERLARGERPARKARKVLAWEDIADEETDLRLDEGQQRQLAESLKKAQQDIRETVWRTYKITRSQRFQGIRRHRLPHSPPAQKLDLPHRDLDLNESQAQAPPAPEYLLPYLVWSARHGVTMALFGFQSVTSFHNAGRVDRSFPRRHI